PLGSPTYDYYGADRLGANLFGNCLLALDARTGERLWHFQTVHHDLWDYDLVSAPQLITVRKEGQKIDAVALATKQGFMFVFDRVTGEPVWPVEEQPVPASDVPGEEAWPTQPHPTVLPPFTRQTVTEADISNLFLSPEEYEQWRIRISKAKKGLYTPISTTETIAMPGAVGGANWGNTASNPDEGLVYVLSQDYPSFYKLEPTPPPLPAAFRQRIATQEAIQRGKVVFEEYCQTCHGSDLAGTANGPALLAIADRLNLQFLRQTVMYGVGRMPGIQHIEEEQISDLLALLKDKATSSGSGAGVEKDMPSGPVVASGGAPGEEALRSSGGFNMAGNDYPEGVEVPPRRYYTGYGLGYPFILNPPWTSITAYDMNAGTIKWTRPLGEDPQAVALGARNTGVPTGSQRNGMIVTSNGLIFSTVTNGKIYAYDADNGNILWTGQVPMGIASLPAMYEVKGRVYLVVNATTPQTSGWNLKEENKGKTEALPIEGAYVVFALPENK
ncbi:MAG: PQQ-binding-like beta-propeller repeat protein, partial [Lewinella sp.]|nr:PQQ-binding-like beta-propeller repeat protein [Lewinella sp.]